MPVSCWRPGAIIAEGWWWCALVWCVVVWVPRRYVNCACLALVSGTSHTDLSVDLSKLITKSTKLTSSCLRARGLWNTYLLLGLTQLGRTRSAAKVRNSGWIWQIWGTCRMATRPLPEHVPCQTGHRGAQTASPGPCGGAPRGKHIRADRAAAGRPKTRARAGRSVPPLAAAARPVARLAPARTPNAHRSARCRGTSAPVLRGAARGFGVH